MIKVGDKLLYEGLYGDCHTPPIERGVRGEVVRLYEEPYEPDALSLSILGPDHDYKHRMAEWRQGDNTYRVFVCELEGYNVLGDDERNHVVPAPDPACRGARP